MMNTFRRAALAALAGTSLLASAGQSLAAMSDYEFRLASSEARTGNDAVVAVTLVDKRTGRPVPDAVIFQTRADMAPDGMETMTSKIEQLPSEEPGVYRFKVGLVMAGGWRISLAAKIQGEEGTLEEKLVVKAVE